MKNWGGRLALLLCIASFMARADGLTVQFLDYEACRNLVQQGEILSMSQLMELVSSLSDGKIIDTRLLQKEDLYIYEMEIAGTDGMVKMLYVDARSGALAESLIANTQ
ncbi:PepSY domain-containing protein [Amphritea balenae]|uniref:PepSY domain-containing protein n=1 Tax=Amphritea balenae TaxID=452629 RepID=A0A3P1SJE3_9GAMM|nr:hypothetical protein [Amphritea balenae]RRC97268.1 hypothetical protein EHS89_18850 [Amphritea balenae]GGK64655.1 hypothetical protein GCM10007941_13530 [Amphritea balenae]